MKQKIKLKDLYWFYTIDGSTVLPFIINQSKDKIKILSHNDLRIISVLDYNKNYDATQNAIKKAYNISPNKPTKIENSLDALSEFSASAHLIQLITNPILGKVQYIKNDYSAYPGLECRRNDLIEQLQIDPNKELARLQKAFSEILAKNNKPQRQEIKANQKQKAYEAQFDF